MRVAYSEAQRVEAVRLFWKLGSATKVVRRLGYPASTHTLMAWVDQRTRAGQVRVSRGRHARGGRARYSPDLRRRVVAAVLEEGMSVSEAAHRFGVLNAPVVYRWLRLAQEGQSLDVIPRNSSRRGESDPPRPHDPARAERAQGRVGPTQSQYLAGLPDDVDVLKRELMMARAELAALREASAAGKDTGVDVTALAAKDKTRIVNAIRVSFPLDACLRVVGLKASTYYYQRARCDKPWKYEHLVEPVRRIAADSSYTYGSARIWMMLRRQGVRVSEKVVRRIITHAAITVHHGRGRRARYSSYQGEISPAPANRLQGHFHSARPGQVLVTDVSVFDTRAGKVYFSPLLDFYDGKILAWRAATHAKEDLTLGMLTDLTSSTDFTPGTVVIHSDRGMHYRSSRWISICESNRITRSMSRKGNSGDNARMEGFFGRMKQEMYHPYTWHTPDQLITAIDAYITFHNTHKINAATGLTIPETRQLHSAP